MTITQLLEFISRDEFPRWTDIPKAFLDSFVKTIEQEAVMLDHHILLDGEQTPEASTEFEVARQVGVFMGSYHGSDYWRYAREELPSRSAEHCSVAGENIGILQAHAWNSEIAHLVTGYEPLQDVYPEIITLPTQ